MGHRGREQPVCPDEPQNRLSSLAQWLKAPLPGSISKIPLIPPLKRPANNPKSLCLSFLDMQLPFLYIQATSKRLLIKCFAGKRKKETGDVLIRPSLEPEGSSNGCRKNWAGLISEEL